MEQTESLFVFRFHPGDALSSKNLIGFESSNVIFEESSDMDAFSLLKKADILITDFSSIFADFLLLDRPMVFAKFDYQGYLRKRELQWDYNEITPGPKVENWKELIFCLNEILVNRKDDYREMRQKIKNEIYLFQDTNACSRIVKEISGRLGLEVC